MTIRYADAMQDRSMLSKFWLVIFALLALPVPTIASPAIDSATAQRCGAKQADTPEHVYADPEGTHHWREYTSAKAVPEMSLEGGESAASSSGSDGNTLIQTMEPGEDFYIYTDYCFDRSGRLTLLRLEVRTAWDWGFREEGPVANGVFTAQSSEFFNTTSNKKIPRPAGADDVPDALKPQVYLSKHQLPFSKLLP